MQKPSHKSIYNLYKSCSTLHKETGKIGFTFLWFFCEFLWNLQVLAKTTKKEQSIYTPVLGNFSGITHIPLLLTTGSLQEWNQAQGSPAAQGSSQPARDGRSWSTSGPGKRAGSPQVYWWQIWDRGHLWRAPTAAQRRRVRGCLKSGRQEGGAR
jgi:hypothetical protein